MDRWRVRVMPVRLATLEGFLTLQPATVLLDVPGFYTSEAALRHVIARLGTAFVNGNDFAVLLQRVPHDPLKEGG